MGRPSNVPKRKGRNDSWKFTPTVKIADEDRQFLVDQLAKLTEYLVTVNYVKSLPRDFRELLDDTQFWIRSGIRHAGGKSIRPRHVHDDLPSEAVLIEKSYRMAQGVDKLIEDCRALKPKSQQKDEDQK